MDGIRELRNELLRLMAAHFKRFAVQIKGVREQTIAVDLRHRQGIESIEKSIDVALKRSNEADEKVARANTAAFKSVNEFRNVLRDQSAKLITRTEVEQQISGITEKISALEQWKNEATGMRSKGDQSAARFLVWIGLAISLVLGVANLVMRMR